MPIPPPYIPKVETPNIATMYLKGMMLKRQQEKDEAEAALAQETLQFKREEMGMKRNELQRQEAIDAQMKPYMDRLAQGDSSATTQIGIAGFAAKRDYAGMAKFLTDQTKYLDDQTRNAWKIALTDIDAGMDAKEFTAKHGIEALSQAQQWGLVGTDGKMSFKNVPPENRQSIFSAFGMNTSGGGATALQQANVVKDSTGRVVGAAVFDGSDRQNPYKVQEPGKSGLRPLKEGEQIVTPTGSMRDTVTGGEFTKLATQAIEEEIGIRRLQKYWSSVKDSKQGFGLLADQFMGAIRTAFGGDLTQKQFNTLVQTGQLQVLIGKIRLETIGGGVMTEQDALRVISALGGDISLLRNKEVVAEQIRTILEDKVRTYNEVTVPRYNKGLVDLDRGGVPEKSPIQLDFDSIFGQRRESQKAGTPGQPAAGRFTIEEVK